MLEKNYMVVLVVVVLLVAVLVAMMMTTMMIVTKIWVGLLKIVLGQDIGRQRQIRQKKQNDIGKEQKKHRPFR